MQIEVLSGPFQKLERARAVGRFGQGPRFASHHFEGISWGRISLGKSG